MRSSITRKIIEHLMLTCLFLTHSEIDSVFVCFYDVFLSPVRVVMWSPHCVLFKLRGQGSSPGRTSTQGLKVIEEKELPLH